MKVLFINPYWNCMSVLYHGLAYLLSVTERKYPVRLLDMTFHFKNHRGLILRELKEYKPDVIGISVNSFRNPLCPFKQDLEERKLIFIFIKI